MIAELHSTASVSGFIVHSGSLSHCHCSLGHLNRTETFCLTYVDGDTYMCNKISNKKKTLNMNVGLQHCDITGVRIVYTSGPFVFQL